MTGLSERVKHIIVNQLSMGATCRIHLHRECCRELGFSLESRCDSMSHRIRICKDMTDSTFDEPLQELLNAGIIEKVKKGENIEGFVFYKLNEEKEGAKP